MVRILILATLLAGAALPLAGCCADACDPISPGDPCLATTGPVDPCEHPCRTRPKLTSNKCCWWRPVPDPCAATWDLPDPCSEASEQSAR